MDPAHTRVDHHEATSAPMPYKLQWAWLSQVKNSGKTSCDYFGDSS